MVPTAGSDDPPAAVLITGAPRSGTTWLGKIFDSHPDVLYRHEPDEVSPLGKSVRGSIGEWIQQRIPRTAAKRPFFRKSWRPDAAWILRCSIAYAIMAVERAGLAGFSVPDLGTIARARPVIKSVKLRGELGAFARDCPDGRALLLLRHPCGQIESVMRGTQGGHFNLATPGTDMAFDEDRARAYAACHGVPDAAFRRLPAAAKYAWAWREFNETAHASIAGLDNARVVIYEDLCRDPMNEARRLLAFADLAWHPQIEAFLISSTNHGGPAHYYSVMRNSLKAAERWRCAMPAENQAAVRAVVDRSPLFHYWDDETASRYAGNGMSGATARVEDTAP